MRRNWLETLANIVIIAAGIAVIATYLSSDPERSPRRPYAVGQSLKLTSGTAFSGPTFVLYTASSCRYCTESMALYRELQAKGARILATTSEPIEANRTYLKSHGIAPVTILSAAQEGLAFTGTPTLLLVDKGGKITGAWYGRQSDSEAIEISRRVQ